MNVKWVTINTAAKMRKRDPEWTKENLVYARIKSLAVEKNKVFEVDNIMNQGTLSLWDIIKLETLLGEAIINVPIKNYIRKMKLDKLSKL